MYKAIKKYMPLENDQEYRIKVRRAFRKLYKPYYMIRFVYDANSLSNEYILFILFYVTVPARLSKQRANI